MTFSYEIPMGCSERILFEMQPQSKSELLQKSFDMRTSDLRYKFWQLGIRNFFLDIIHLSSNCSLLTSLGSYFQFVSFLFENSQIRHAHKVLIKSNKTHTLIQSKPQSRMRVNNQLQIMDQNSTVHLASPSTAILGGNPAQINIYLSTPFRMRKRFKWVSLFDRCSQVAGKYSRCCKRKPRSGRKFLNSD